MIILDILIQLSNSSTYAIMSLKIKLSLSQHKHIQLMNKNKLANVVHPLMLNELYYTQVFYT
jgi:hypothetical protein